MLLFEKWCGRLPTIPTGQWFQSVLHVLIIFEEETTPKKG